MGQPHQKSRCGKIAAAVKAKAAAGVPNSVGYFEIADTLETSRNSGIWRSPGFTIDGLHPSPTGYAATVAGIDIAKVSRT